MLQTGLKTVTFIDEGCPEKLKCMTMFQWSVCDMHFGIVKFNGFLSKLFYELQIEFFFVNLTERQVRLFSKIQTELHYDFFSGIRKQFQRKHESVPLKISSM